MESRPIGKVTVYFEPGEEGAAELVGGACEQSLELIGELWKLEAPSDCRVYIMTAWQPFLLHAAPGPWRVYLRATLPLRRARFQQVWDLAGGWALRYGQRRVVGIKPPRLLSGIDAARRERVFVPREVDEAVRHNVCHELVHVCSDFLRLPTWLHEGLAMVTVDRLARRPTVKADTLAALSNEPRGAAPTAGWVWAGRAGQPAGPRPARLLDHALPGRKAPGATGATACAAAGTRRAGSRAGCRDGHGPGRVLAPHRWHRAIAF